MVATPAWTPARRRGRPGGSQRAEQRVEAVERALGLLEAFADGTPRLSLADLSRRTGLYPSTLLRIAASLERGGMLARGADGLFRLGPATFRLGMLYRAAFDLGAHVRPVLARLVERTAETAVFHVREGDARLCLFRQESARPVRHHMAEGAQLTLDRGAGGHVLRAFTEPADAAHDAVRAAGFALSFGERDPEIAAMAVPVFGDGGRFAGALGLSGPIGRFDAARLPALEAVLREEGAALSRALGAR